MNASVSKGGIHIQIEGGICVAEIANIHIGERARKEMGDITALARSIREIGLIHPPAITPNGKLISGHRRLQACVQLGMDRIPVRVIEVDDLLSAERDENQVRKDFTPSEAVALGRLIEGPLKEKALAEKKKKVSAAKKAEWARKRGEKVDVSKMETPTSDRHSHVTAASAVGLSNGAYAQAKEVVEAAEQAPEQFGDLLERMDATRNISAAHKELRSRRNGEPGRHAVLHKMRHRDANKEIERAITTLEGLAFGVERIDVASLDPGRATTWAKEIKRHLAVINRLVRSLSHECSN